MSIINHTTPQSQPYLKPLSYLTKPPQTIHYLGRLPDHRLPSVAIVGSRRPTRYGYEVTEQFAAALSRQGIVIVSGLALGVDSVAHRACLDAGGITIAVLATPLPRIYPASHQLLAKEIIKQNGAVISEHVQGDGSTFGNWSFLKRNRLVSGLADAIIITEAAARSGTLNTAAHALEQGREVFVVPGNITSPLSQGCNNLLKQGAQVATSPDDILAVIAPHQPPVPITLPLGQTPLENSIIDLLHQGLRDGETIQRQLKAPVSEFNVALTTLQVQGAIRSLGANQWTIK